MKYILLLAILISALAQGADDSLKKGYRPKFYKKRSEPILNIGLIYYGDYYKTEDLERVGKLFEERFFESTNRLLKINTVFRSILPFANKITQFPEYQNNNITDMERLQRLWYYDNVNARIIDEVYKQVRKTPDLKASLGELDALLIVTGAQFSALGYAVGRIGVTENPMEIAWGLPGQGRVEFVSDAKVVDELIHELGHIMFLDHTSNPCFKEGQTVQQMNACCAESPNRNDVMSYCRKRDKVNDSFYYKFESCNLGIIENKIIPAMLKGKRWNIADRPRCL